jgi:hypothetical protein
MDRQSFAQFAPLLFWYAITVVPTFLVIRRTGMSPWWGLLLIFPLLGFVVVLWIIVFARWPDRPQAIS